MMFWRLFSRLRPIALAGLAALCLSVPAHAGGGPMQFRVEPLQMAGCGERCPNVVVADGVIEPDTPQIFVDFAREAARSQNLKSVMLINSPGGNVVASMEFGARLRQLGMAAIVASYGFDGMHGGPAAGECVSACVYALMGAVRRIAPEQSHVALHRMSVSYAETPTRGKAAAVSRRLADGRLVDIVAKYARQMGVNPEVVRQAERGDPDHVQLLTAGEMSRWRLASPKL